MAKRSKRPQVVDITPDAIARPIGTLRHGVKVAVIYQGRTLTGVVEGGPWCDRHGADVVRINEEGTEMFPLPCTCDRNAVAPNRVTLIMNGRRPLDIRIVG